MALAYAARCHAGQRRESDGAPFIEHVSEVARLLRDAGCADVLVAAGLLHSVLQDTDVSAAELSARFGVTVSELVQATTDDCVGSYAQRQHVLREQIRNAGRDAALLFAANEIAEVRALGDHVRRERARVGAGAVRDGARDSLERYQQMRLREYHASLAMLLAVAPRHRLVRQLASELAQCPLGMRRPQRVGASPTTARSTSPQRPERARLRSPSTSAAKTASRSTRALPYLQGPGDRGAIPTDDRLTPPAERAPNVSTGDPCALDAALRAPPIVAESDAGS